MDPDSVQMSTSACNSTITPESWSSLGTCPYSVESVATQEDLPTSTHRWETVCRYAGRKRQHAAGWSPIGVSAPKRRFVRTGAPVGSCSSLNQQVCRNTSMTGGF